ncbi:hypothetical protein M426DRAFT_325461 [Hypoxylon sp. CI-4A]|nr:hypothetical protein M426DRAFT_325461 [Hypoxylon sp. CI-4A]
MDIIPLLSLFSQGSASQVALPGALLGILFEVTMAQIFDLEYVMYQLIGIFLFVIIGLASIYIKIGFSPLDTLARLSIIGASFNAGLFSTMIIYRLYFHRLKHFPGPGRLRISRFFSALLAAKDLKYHEEVAKLHETYGDFIRTGPRELCIVRKSAVPLIYGTNTKCRKSTFYVSGSPNPRKSSIVSTTDVDDHRRRRRAWDRGLGVKACQSYEQRIKVLADQLISHISQRGIIDVTEKAMYLTFDVMGSVGLGRSMNCVAHNFNHPAIKAIHDHMGIFSIGTHVPYLLNLLANIPKATAGYAPFYKYCHDQVVEKRKTLDLSKTPQDILSWLLKAVIEKDISASPTKESLDEDSRALIIAGSDTNGTTLAAALYFMAKYPFVAQKLQSQIDAVMPGGPAHWDYEKVKTITYLDHIIQETLRLKPATLTGGYRVTPPEGLQVDEQFIPGNISVFVPTQLIQIDPRYWKQATEFVPERWDERKDEMGTDGIAYNPFSQGSFACVGKPLAMLTLRIAISTLLQTYDVSFAPGETGEAFDRDARDTFTTSLKPLMLQFSRRK